MEIGKADQLNRTGSDGLVRGSSESFSSKKMLTQRGSFGGIKASNTFVQRRDLYIELMRVSAAGNTKRLVDLLEVLSKEEASQLDFRRNQPSFGETALHCAATVKTAALLIEHGLPVNIKGSVDQTPLHTVQDVSVANYLISRGARVNSRTKDGSTPLHWAVVVDNLPVVKVLVRAGADVNVQNLNGNSPIHVVSSIKVAKYLVTHGSRLDLQNEHGQIPLEVAAEKGDDEAQLQVAAFLLDVSHDITRFTPLPSQPVLSDHTTISVPEEKSSLNSKSVQRMGSLEKSKKVLSQTNARERWKMIRTRVITGHYKQEAGGGEENSRAPRDSRKLRFDTLTDMSTGSAWSEDLDEPDDGRLEFYSSFFELMVRDRPKLALKMLDKNRVFLYARGNEKIFSYDVSLLGGPTDSRPALSIIVGEQRYELITHEIVQWVLNIRWILFTRECLLYEFFLHAIYVLIFTFTTLFGTENLLSCWAGVLSMLQNPANKTSEHLVQANQLIFEMFLLYLTVRHLLRHLVERRLSQMDGSVYLQYKPYETMFDLLPYLFVLVQQVMRSIYTQDDELAIRISNVVAAAASIILWIRLLSFAEGFETIGVAMSTIRRMIRDILIYLFMLLVFITGFSHALTLVFKDSNEDTSYRSMTNSWITLFFFVFNLDVGALDSEPSPFRRYFGYLFIGIYMIVVALVILNLIIAIMTNTFDEIQQNAKEQWLLQRARLILRYDTTEIALNRIHDYCRRTFPLRILCCIRGRRRSYFRDSMPILPRKNSVVEKSNGTISIHVPCEWLHALNRSRTQSNNYHKFRYWCFRSWKKFRRSPSFLWPSTQDTQQFFDAEEEQAIRDYRESNTTSMTFKSLGDDLSVLDDPTNSNTNHARSETSPLLHEDSDAESVPEYGTMDSPTPALQKYSSVENSAMRTGNDEALEYLGRFLRDPKRISLEKKSQEQAMFRRLAHVGSTYFAESPKPSVKVQAAETNDAKKTESINGDSPSNPQNRKRLTEQDLLDTAGASRSRRRSTGNGLGETTNNFELPSLGSSVSQECDAINTPHQFMIMQARILESLEAVNAKLSSLEKRQNTIVKFLSTSLED